MIWEIQDKPSTDCQVVAVINACKYLAIDPPSREALSKRFHCEHDPCIGTFEAKDLPVRFDKKRYITQIKSCGIITIMHPIYNLHSVFMIKRNSFEVTLINSLLGYPEVNIGMSSLGSLMPTWENNRSYIETTRR